MADLIRRDGKTLVFPSFSYLYSSEGTDKELSKKLKGLLTCREIERLKEEGYTPIEYAGEGAIRAVIVAHYSKGGLDQLRVLKIPKDLVGNGRLGSKICASKGNPNIQEAGVGGEIDHPNVSGIEGVIELRDRTEDREDGTIERRSVTINVGKYIKGQTLEEKVLSPEHVREYRETPSSYLARSPEAFKHLFGQVIAGANYLHGKGIVHRDLKPSNIMIDNHGTVKIIDLQSAAYIDEVSDSALPTFGGVTCAHPEFLDSLIKGVTYKASFKTEMYSLGATMYFALTGSYPFKYVLRSDSQGKALYIGNQIETVSLYDGEKKVKELDKKKHARDLEDKLEKIPRRYRKMIRSCLSLDEEFRDYNVNKLKQDFEEACKPGAEEVWEQVKEKGKWLSVATFLTWMFGAATGAVIDGMHYDTGVRETTIQDVLMENFNKTNRSLGSAGSSYDDDISSVDELRKYFNLLPKMLEANKEKISEIEHSVRSASGIHRYFDQRLINSLITSIALEPQGNVSKVAEADKRLEGTLVPRNFVYQVILGERDERKMPPEMLNDMQRIAYAGVYLSHGVDVRESPADALAKYFFSREEIFGAMERAKSDSYFYNFRSTGKGTTKSVEGYGKYLPWGPKKVMLDRAIALYLMKTQEAQAQKKIRLEHLKTSRFAEAK